MGEQFLSQGGPGFTACRHTEPQGHWGSLLGGRMVLCRLSVSVIKTRGCPQSHFHQENKSWRSGPATLTFSSVVISLRKAGAFSRTLNLQAQMTWGQGCQPHRNWGRVLTFHPAAHRPHHVLGPGFQPCHWERLGQHRGNFMVEWREGRGALLSVAPSPVSSLSH